MHSIEPRPNPTFRALTFAAILFAAAPAHSQPAATAAAPTGAPGVSPQLVAADAPTGAPGVSPQLVAAASQVWSVIARPDNPVWPGWDASRTPLLLYLPNRQDLLVNHPHPPEGFVPYGGPVRMPGARMLVKNGPTLITSDGQNTSRDVAGVRTLVVADPLSNLRLRVAGLIQDPRPADDKVRDLTFEPLYGDPYSEMGMVAHEAFHVFQDSVAPDRSNEMLVLAYPVLSAENNVGMALEASALAEAIGARDAAARRAAALRWLAVRLDRRQRLPARAIQYEDGIEFVEGLAKYVEYRLFEVLEGRRADDVLNTLQGFHGFADLAPQRAALVRDMQQNLRGEVNINNDPYGTAPVRFRCYYSGMAIGVLLDRFAPNWKHDVIASDTSLTALLRDALHATPDELSRALGAAQADTALPRLRAAKQKLERDGEAELKRKLASIDSGPGVRLVVDYSAFHVRGLPMRFSPFGVQRVDSTRTLFQQVPISVTFPDQSSLEQTFALPLLRDVHTGQLSCRLARAVSRAELERMLGGPARADAPPRAAKLDLPDVKLDVKSARVVMEPGTIRVVLVPAEVGRK